MHRTMNGMHFQVADDVLRKKTGPIHRVRRSDGIDVALLIVQHISGSFRCGKIRQRSSMKERRIDHATHIS